MSLLVIAIDRDNDLGRKTGIRSPVIGREANIRASLELGLSDPEESDTNTMLAAIKTYDQLLEKGKKVEVVTICGDVRVGTNCLLYTSPSPRDAQLSRMPSSA